MCVCECGGHRWNSQLFSMLPLETRSPAEPGTHWSIQNVCPVTSAGIVVALALWVSNSGPQASVACTLPTESSPQLTVNSQLDL